MCAVPDGADNGCDEWRDETTLSLPENEGESPSEEDAGTDRSQQEDTGADPYACKKERKLRTGEGLRTCPQGADESSCLTIR